MPKSDHQPLAVPDNGRWRPGCLCGWQAGYTVDNRAVALIDARRHEDSTGAAA